MFRKEQESRINWRVCNVIIKNGWNCGKVYWLRGMSAGEGNDCVGSVLVRGELDKGE